MAPHPPRDEYRSLFQDQKRCSYTPDSDMCPDLETFPLRLDAKSQIGCGVQQIDYGVVPLSQQILAPWKGILSLSHASYWNPTSSGYPLPPFYPSFPNIHSDYTGFVGSVSSGPSQTEAAVPNISCPGGVQIYGSASRIPDRSMKLSDSRKTPYSVESTSKMHANFADMVKLPASSLPVDLLCTHGIMNEQICNRPSSEQGDFNRVSTTHSLRGTTSLAVKKMNKEERAQVLKNRKARNRNSAKVFREKKVALQIELTNEVRSLSNKYSILRDELDVIWDENSKYKRKLQTTEVEIAFIKGQRELENYECFLTGEETKHSYDNDLFS